MKSVRDLKNPFTCNRLVKDIQAQIKKMENRNQKSSPELPNSKSKSTLKNKAEQLTAEIIDEQKNGKNRADLSKVWNKTTKEINQIFIIKRPEPVSAIIARAESDNKKSFGFFQRFRIPVFASAFGMLFLGFTILWQSSLFHSREYPIKAGNMIAVDKGRVNTIDLSSSWKIDLESGLISVKLANFESKEFVFAAEIAKAKFTLNSKINLTIVHPIIEIVVLGTVFEFDLYEESGSVSVSRGKVLLRHRNGNEKILEKDQKSSFGIDGFHEHEKKFNQNSNVQEKQLVQPVVSPSQEKTQNSNDILYLKSGIKLEGKFQGSDEELIHFKTVNGIQNIRRSDIQELKLNATESP